VSQKEEDVTSVLMEEERILYPSEAVINAARIKDWDAELKAGDNIEKYWREKAEQFEWFSKWTKILDDSNKPFYKWFVDGKTNISYNALDKHIDTNRRNKIALL